MHSVGMKANRKFCSSLVVASTVACTANSLLAVDSIPAPSSKLEIRAGAGTNIASVKVVDAYNRVWLLQSSSNLTAWTDVAAIKIHNGSFARSIAKDATFNQFFRAYHDSAQQDLLSTIESALHLPSPAFNYATPVLPPAFTVNPILAQDNTPLNNLTTDNGAALGRVLFYDKRLSTNQTISCSSCHQQAHGFSDPRKFSVGFNGGLTGRNSMGLSHARWYQRRHFFWDERANTLEDQVLQPIQNAVEMGMTLDALTNRLNSEPFYTNLFARSFGSPVVTSDRISRALAQFVRSIVSVQTKYDLGVSNNFANFTPQENQGRQLFLGQAGCAACHGTDNFVPGPALNNNGLEFPYVDLGVGGITGNPADNGKFKVPSLRNIELTTPYMHDGRFTNLEQVVEFYNSGVVDNPNLSPPLRNPPGSPNAGQPRRLNLTPQQKAALVAFLKTLTDPNLATNEKYSDPFNYGN